MPLRQNTPSTISGALAYRITPYWTDTANLVYYKNPFYRRLSAFIGSLFYPK
jgi:hypothetical protein